MNSNNETQIVKKNNKKILIITITAIALVILVAVGVVLTINVRSANREKALQEQLDLGNKYLNELDYEQAIIAYEAAIEIDPMSVEAYLGLADAYVAMGDYNNAILVLEKGFELTNDSGIKDYLEELRIIVSHVHTWIEANFQEPAICSECGEIDGEPLVPDYITRGLTANVELGQAYDYITCCSNDMTITTVGELTFSDYKIFSSDENHEAKAGYEWRTVHASIVFNDDNAWQYGTAWRWLNDNYYEEEETTEINEYGNDDGEHFTVNYYGKDYEDCLIRIENEGYNNWQVGYGYEAYMDFAFLVPVGYDGIVVGFTDRGIVAEDMNDYFNENTLLFRLD